MSIALMTAADAMRQSAARDTIIHVLGAGTVQADLRAACDDWTDAGRDETGAIYEYWGTDADGDTWRVHVHVASGH